MIVVAMVMAVLAQQARLIEFHIHPRFLYFLIFFFFDLISKLAPELRHRPERTEGDKTLQVYKNDCEAVC